jgi:polygalacturonase
MQTRFFILTLMALTLLAVPGCTRARAGFQVENYGAVGDGTTLNTTSIQAAIDACADSGGGRVVIAGGTFLSGTLVMKDHVELHIKKGSILLGSTNPAHYPELTTPYRFFGDEWVKQSLIFGDRLEDIALSGKGIIDGQGAAFQVATKKKPDRYRNRPFLIRFTRCRGVTVEDLTLQNSAMWMQHYLACDDVKISGITVINHCNKNNDMMDIDGCRNVVIENCKGDTDDDGLTLKSTSPRACENIVISNCVLSSHCNAIKMGTESVGGFKNITITNCVIKPSAQKQVIYGLPEGISGISLEVVDGGVMEEVFISDVTMDGPEVPLFIRLGNRARPHMEGLAAPPVGRLENIRIEKIEARNVGNTGCSITGIPGFDVKNIKLSHFKLEFPGGVKKKEVEEEEEVVPELEELYPEATMFGRLPASVFYLRHVEGIEISDVRVTFREVEKREPLVAEDVSGLKQEKIQITQKK